MADQNFNIMEMTNQKKREGNSERKKNNDDNQKYDNHVPSTMVIVHMKWIIEYTARKSFEFL